MGETRTLAQFVADLRYDSLPALVVEQACRIIVDTVGCALSAWSVDPDKSLVARGLAELYPSQAGGSVIGVAGVKAQPASPRSLMASSRMPPTTTTPTSWP